MSGKSIINKLISKVVIVLMLTLNNIFSQGKCTIALDEKSGDQILIGIISENILSDTSYSPFGRWYVQEYEDYKVDSLLVDSIKTKINSEIKIVAIFGTWCSDSKREVPRFMKILNKVNFDKKNLKMICVDRNKKAGEVNIDNYEIKLVPTFIFYHNQIEIGRIVEMPNISLEKDFLRIISNIDN
ncbi:MAG: thioredoxin family protein [Melioribacter sp.]|nr:thioredoxin family protein [Melioribacter sp.]